MEFCGVVSFLVVLFGQGPVVAVLVQWLKRLPFIQENPLVTAAVLNALVAITTNVIWCGIDLGQLLSQLAAGFSMSVATYEVGKGLGVISKPPSVPPVETVFDRE